MKRDIGKPKDGHKEDIKIAKDLCYPKEVIEMLKNEPDSNKRCRILHDARTGVYDKRKRE